MFETAVEIIFRGENPKSIFEVGISSGRLMQEMYEKGVILGGLDRKLPEAKDYYPKFVDNFIQWDATKTPQPIKDKSWDIVFTSGVLLLIPDPFPVLKEMLRIAKGKVIISEIQDNMQDEYGEQGKIEQPSHNNLRIKRDYWKVFKKLKVKAIIKGEAPGKTIFEICKKKTKTI